MEVCKKFEDAFGFTWNNDVQAYIINDTLHDKPKIQNALVTFTLGGAVTSKTIDISLPYAAFDLIAVYPLMPNRTRYFPLIRAANNS